MSSGTVHTKASLILSGGFVVGTILSGDYSNIQYVAGSLIGIMITPDCDVDRGFSADRYIRQGIGRVAGRRIGLWVEKIWDGLWYFYRKSLKHGQELSHLPPLGTIGRVAYLFLMLIVIPHFLVYMAFSPDWDLWYVMGWYWGRIWDGWKIILGLVGADTIHYVLDQTDLIIRDFEKRIGLR